MNNKPTDISEITSKNNFSGAFWNWKPADSMLNSNDQCYWTQCDRIAGLGDGDTWDQICRTSDDEWYQQHIYVTPGHTDIQTSFISTEKAAEELAYHYFNYRYPFEDPDIDDTPCDDFLMIFSETICNIAETVGYKMLEEDPFPLDTDICVEMAFAPTASVFAAEEPSILDTNDHVYTFSEFFRSHPLSDFSYLAKVIAGKTSAEDRAFVLYRIKASSENDIRQYLLKYFKKYLKKHPYNKRTSSNPSDVREFFLYIAPLLPEETQLLITQLDGYDTLSEWICNTSLHRKAVVMRALIKRLSEWYLEDDDTEDDDEKEFELPFE